MEIEYKEELNEELCKKIDIEFDEFAKKNDVICNYKGFCFVAKENEEIIGIITGHSYYNEVHISDLIVMEPYRNKKIGTKLVQKVEDYFKDKNFENINLNTYGFQAPGFYKKCGYTLDYVRENPNNPKLSKYFFVKYF